MSARLIEGADWCSAASQLAGRGTVSGSIATTTGLQGSGVAYRFDPTSAVEATLQLQTEQDISTGRVILHFRMRVNTNFVSASGAEILRVKNTAGSTIFNLFITSTGSLQVRRGTTAVLTIASFYAIGVVYHVQVDVTIHASTGEAEVWKDGVSVGSATGLNTAGAAGDVRFVQMGSSTNTSNYTIDFDDILVDDATRRGQVDVKYYPVDEDVSEVGFAPSTGSSQKDVLDEVPGSEADYTVSSNDGDNVRCGITPALGSINPIAVQPIALARVEVSSTSELELTLHSGASDDGGRSHVLTTSLRGYVGVLSEEDPDTSNPWSPGDLDGVELVAAHVVP